MDVRKNTRVRRRVQIAMACLAAVLPASSDQALAPREAEKMFPAIAELAMSQEPFPDNAKAKIDLTGGGAVEIEMGEEARVAAPLRIRFEGLSDSYCRLAVWDRAKGAAELVPIPLETDYDDCRGMRKLAAVDLNHDGVTDWIFRVERPSATVDAVYVSQPGRRTYCYAPVASKGVSALAPADGDKAREEIEREIAQRGDPILECYDPSQQ